LLICFFIKLLVCVGWGVVVGFFFFLSSF